MRRRSGGVGDGLYADLKDIAMGSPPQTPLDTEKALCGKYGISRITVRAAMRRLLDEGLIYRIKGSGTFVSLHDGNKSSRETIVYSQWSGSFSHPFFSEMMKGIIEKAGRYGADVSIIPYKLTPADNEAAFIKAAGSPWCMGAIVPFFLEDIWAMLRKANPQISIVTTTLRPEKMPRNACSFTLDAYEFGRLAGGYLAGCGVEAVLYVGCDKAAMAGVRSVADSAGKKYLQIPLKSASEFDIDGIIRKLSGHEGHGLVIGDDVLARKLFDAFYARGINPAKRFKIASYANKGDRFPLEGAARIEFDGFEMGEKCVAMLFAMKADPSLRELDVSLRPKLKLLSGQQLSTRGP